MLVARGSALNGVDVAAMGLHLSLPEETSTYRAHLESGARSLGASISAPRPCLILGDGRPNAGRLFSVTQSMS